MGVIRIGSRRARRAHLYVSCLVILFAGRPALAGAGSRSSVLDSPTFGGILRTVTTDGSPLDRIGPFFQRLGTNGRTCASCHVPQTAWTITPVEVKLRFERTGGLDPIFRTVDGSNSPRSDVSSVLARRRAYSMLLEKGVIRVGMPIPAGAEFELVAVDDPYHYASSAELSLFRRPLPATNLRFLTTVMWDGRESYGPGNTSPIQSTATVDQNEAALVEDLMHQAADATAGHAQGLPPSADQLTQIVQFELGLATAQQFDILAGNLDVRGALGGPANLLDQPFYVTINDVLGDDARHPGVFDANSMNLFDAWSSSDNRRRASIARGAALFAANRINITGVAGLNDDLGAPSIRGSCSACHDTPDVGNHSVALPIDIGISDASRRTPDMPLYTLRNLATGKTRQTTDPGRALITGRWNDIGKFKGPILRGLAARPPYFHDGSAADLGQVIDFYDARFGIGFTPQEKADIVAFLSAL